MIPPAGVHGGDGATVARALGLDPDQVLDLSMSLNPCATDIADIAARYLGSLRRYPDRAAATCTLAAAMGVDPARLLLTNGASEAIRLAANLLGGTIVAEPEFSLHPRTGDGPRWRSNPNNPTGLLAAPAERADVWDESFFALSTGRWTRGDADAVVIGSLTKLFACPGLRLGYLLADDVHRFAVTQPAWPVNGLALAVLPDLIASADLSGWAHAIARRRVQLATLLASHGYLARASDAPWLLAQAPGLRERLAPFGVIVRDCASFGLPGLIRIAVPDEAGLDRLAEALACAGR
jgi:histidinol-phosphate/aromatic aminotransferase/cobyric acid decarboxylase-like protein